MKNGKGPGRSTIAAKDDAAKKAGTQPGWNRLTGGSKNKAGVGSKK